MLSPNTNAGKHNLIMKLKRKHNQTRKGGRMAEQIKTAAPTTGAATIDIDEYEPIEGTPQQQEGLRRTLEKIRQARERDSKG